MSLEQAIVTVLVAFISAIGTLAVEKARQRRKETDETNKSRFQLEQARITDEVARRQEISEAAREIRDFLQRRVDELDHSLTNIEVQRAAEREKWNQMLGQLSVKNLELELQSRRDKARVHELEEDANHIDDEIKILRTRIMTLEGEAVILTARLKQEQLERTRLQQRLEKGETDHGSDKFSD